MDWRRNLEGLAESIPVHDVPAGIAACEHVRAVLLKRLVDGHAVQETPTTPLDAYLTAGDVASRLGVDRRWVYRHQDELGALHLSERCIRFPQSQLDRYIAEQHNQ